MSGKMTENNHQEEKNQDNQKKNQKKSKQLLEMKELLQRTQANFENYCKQTEKRMQEMQQIAAKEIIIQLLPIRDNLALALKNIEKVKGNNENKEFRQGVELIYFQLGKLLEERGIKEIETENKPYDPNLHEALIKVESELPENFIVEEFQKGFTWHGKVVRPAMVKISAGRKGQENNKENQDNNAEEKNGEEEKIKEEIKEGKKFPENIEILEDN